MKDDEGLLKAFIEGDRKALDELAGRYELPLLNLAMAMLGSREPAMDAVQDAWVRVIRYAGRFGGRSTFKTWLYRIAINACRDVRSCQSEVLERKTELAATNRGEDSADTRGPSVVPSNGRAVLTGGCDPATEVVRQEQFSELKRAVESLSPELREVVLLCYTQGLTHSEAAEALEIPIGTLKSRLHAALEELRARVKS